MRKTLFALLLVFVTLLSTGCNQDEDDKKATKEAIVGEALQCDTFQITLTEVAEYVDTDEFKMDEPDDGKMFVILKFKIEGIGSENDYFNMFYEDSYCDDVSIDPTMLFNYDGDTVWGDIVSGKTRVGYIAYEVDKNWNKIDFIYQYDLTDDDCTMTFTAYKKDMK